MNKITLINCIVFVIIHEVQCDVVLLAVKEEFNDSAKFTFSCYSSIESLDCSAEFLYNIKTLDTLRSSAGKCYHKQQLCSREKCSCSEECNTFILIITNHKYKNGDIIGCEVQHMNDGNILSTTAEIIYNGSVFRFHKTHVSTVAKPDRYSSTSPTTEQNDVIGSNTGEETGIAVVIVIAIVLLIIGCCWIRRKTNQARRDNISGRRQNHIRTDFLSGELEPFLPNTDIPISRPNEIPLGSHEDLNITRRRPLTAISTNRDSREYLNITRPRPLSAISTKESHEYLNITRPRPLSSISTNRDSYNYLNITRPRPLSAISTKDSNSTSDDSIWTNSSAESYRNFNKARPGSFSTKDV